MWGVSSAPIGFTSFSISPWVDPALEARHLDEAVEHVALGLGDPAECIRVDPDEPKVGLWVDAGFEGHPRELEHRREVVGGSVVRLGTDLAQSLLEREDEVDGQADLLGHLLIGPRRERREPVVGAPHEVERETTLLDGTRDRLDRESTLIG